MSKIVHRLYLTILSVIVVFTLVYSVWRGADYYLTSLEERFFHPDHSELKPSGIIGHGVGILGSLMMLLGVTLYMVRKRYRIFSRLGLLKHWLEFHIFLCTLGPILVLFHTSFKFGGIVAISFWSMVAVFLSGIIGRFIYLQIPRSIEGRELSLSEVRGMKGNIGESLKESVQLDEKSYHQLVDATRRGIETYKGSLLARMIRRNREDGRSLKAARKLLKEKNIPRDQRNTVLRLLRNEVSLNRRIDRLQTMQNLFKYWHVAHLPFALVMLVIMVIHVAVTIVFGYRWIF